MGRSLVSYGFGLALELCVGNVAFAIFFQNFYFYFFNRSYIISMKKIIFILSLIVLIALTGRTIAVCQIAKPEHATECFSDPSGECCLVAFDQEGALCVGAVCYDYGQCSWEEFIPIRCDDT